MWGDGEQAARGSLYLENELVFLDGNALFFQ